MAMEEPRIRTVPAAKIYFPPEDLEALSTTIKEILEAGRLTLGPYTEEFEKAFAAAHGRRFAVAVSSGTSALEIILRALRIRDADVFVPTNTFAATAFAVLRSGNRVVLADVDQNLCLDLSDVARRITTRTKAVVTVHIGGRVVPAVERLRALCEEKGLALIEDAAHAHGSHMNGHPAGSFGVAAAFSFYPTKVITSGEGGMIVTDDEELDAVCRVFRDQGKAGFSQNLHTELGSNARLSEIHAAIGLSQLRRLGEFIDARRRAAEVYDEGLEDLEGFRGLYEEAGMRSNYYKYIVVPPKGTDRAALKSRLAKERGVSLSGEVYEVPLHAQPVFATLAKGGPGFPVADDLCRRHICLPVHARMTADDAGYVVEALQEATA